MDHVLSRPSAEKPTKKLQKLWRKWTSWVRRKVPPGARTLLGLVLIVGGIFGMLPVLGFWMLPLGIVVVAMDVRSLFAFLNGGLASKRTDDDRSRRG